MVDTGHSHARGERHEVGDGDGVESDGFAVVVDGLPPLLFVEGKSVLQVFAAVHGISAFGVEVVVMEVPLPDVGTAGGLRLRLDNFRAPGAQMRLARGDDSVMEFIHGALLWTGPASLPCGCWLGCVRYLNGIRHYKIGRLHVLATQKGECCDIYFLIIWIASPEWISSALNVS